MAINYYSFIFLLLSIVLHLFLFSGCSLKKVEAYRFKEMTVNVQNKTHVVSLSSLMPAEVCSTPPKDSHGRPNKSQLHPSVISNQQLSVIQCLPCCGQCYTQQDPYFNPSASSTYSNISCGSNACSQLNSEGLAQSSCTNVCLYQVSYGDQSYTQGNFATETLTLSSSDVFSNFEFRCGENNQGTFGTADGLLGLGRSQISMVSQTAQKYGESFSYCLPSTSSSTGFLAFGSQAGSSSTLQYTPQLKNSNYASFYVLNMTGISVGGKSVSIAQFTTSGTFIDSGTVITCLAPKAYSALRLAFRQAMSNYRTAPPYAIFDTCYDLSGYCTVTLPSVVLHFDDFKMDYLKIVLKISFDQSGILYQINSSLSLYCLAFAGNSAATDLGILGNTQQKTFEVVFNVAGGKLGFGAETCT